MCLVSEWVCLVSEWAHFVTECVCLVGKCEWVCLESKSSVGWGERGGGEGRRWLEESRYRVEEDEQ